MGKAFSKGRKIPFYDSFTNVLEQMTLTDYAKNNIRLRYVAIVVDSHKQHERIMVSHNCHRIMILLSGILIPTLVSINDNVPNQTAMFWVTLTVSLMGSISTAWTEYFNTTQMHYTYLALAASLEQEGWSFASLSGRYSKYKLHEACWKKFMNNVERLHALGINKYMDNIDMVRTSMENREHGGAEELLMVPEISYGTPDSDKGSAGAEVSASTGIESKTDTDSEPDSMV